MMIDEATLDLSHQLISSRRVEGTPVYDRAGHKLGTIHSVMIEKTSGRVAYAVLAFGGVLGIGEHVHPIPWEVLTYDVERDGYAVDLSRDSLRNAPTLRLDEADRPHDPAMDRNMSEYYGTMNWWGL